MPPQEQFLSKRQRPPLQVQGGHENDVDYLCVIRLIDAVMELCRKFRPALRDL